MNPNLTFEENVKIAGEGLSNTLQKELLEAAIYFQERLNQDPEDIVNAITAFVSEMADNSEMRKEIIKNRSKNRVRQAVKEFF